MKFLKVFGTKEEYENEKYNLSLPNVSYTRENDGDGVNFAPYDYNAVYKVDTIDPLQHYWIGLMGFPLCGLMVKN